MTKVSSVVALAIGAISFAGIAAAGSGAADRVGGDLVSVGPLDLVEATSVTVLGRSYHIDNTMGLQAGDKVAVHGQMQSDGSVVNAWLEPLGSYTAGSDWVFETGVVTRLNDTLGTLSLNGTEVDYTQVLAAGSAAAPAVGDLISVSGTQPNLGGVVLGTTTRAGSTEIAMAYSGFSVVGKASYSGTRTAGYTGSGGAGYTGSGGAGYTGSGSAGYTGSGGAGYTGSGGAGYTGSGGAGYTGSGGAGYTGSGGAGYTGSGGAGYTGSGGAGYTGSGGEGYTGSGGAGYTGSGGAGYTGSGGEGYTGSGGG